MFKTCEGSVIVDPKDDFMRGHVEIAQQAEVGMHNVT
jgi:hypothetical protein